MDPTAPRPLLEKPVQSAGYTQITKNHLRQGMQKAPNRSADANKQTGIYIIGVPMCLSILHCGGFPSSAQYSSIDTILSFAVFMNDTTWK